MTKTPSECNSLYPALFLVVFSLPQCFSIVHCEGSVSLLSSELLPFFFTKISGAHNFSCSSGHVIVL